VWGCRSELAGLWRAYRLSGAPSDRVPRPGFVASRGVGFIGETHIIILVLCTTRLGASHCKMPLLGFLASATLATSIGRLMEGDAPVSPAARPTWGTCGGTDCC